MSVFQPMLSLIFVGEQGSKFLSFCVSSSVVGMMVLALLSPQRLVLSDPAFVLTEDQLLACHASLTALLSVRLFVIEH